MIPSLQNVLVVTDLSDFGNEAILYGYAIAAPGAIVSTLHVIERIEAPSPLYAHYTPGETPTDEERERQHAATEEQMRALSPAEAADKNLVSRTIVREHNVVTDAIIHVADEIDADIIVMASHGRSGVMKALLGSTAESVMEDTDRPVLVVRPRKV